LADLILHVVDGSEPEQARLASIAAADSVLEEIGAGSKPRLLVMNKIDLLGDEERRELAMRHRDAVLVSAETGEGLGRLREKIAAQIRTSLTEVELLVPFAHGEWLSELHEVAGDLQREDRADGVLVRALLPAPVAERFSDLAVNGRGGDRRAAEAGRD
jgi:GTP-binding protein HflX